MSRVVFAFFCLLLGTVVHASVIVVEGVSHVQGQRGADEAALDDAFKKALQLISSQLTESEALKMRGALIENKFRSQWSQLIKRHQIIAREHDGDTRKLKVSVDVDIEKLKNLLRREGFFRGRDLSRAMILVSIQQLDSKGQPSLLSWWWSEQQSAAPEVALLTKAINGEVEKIWNSKGFLFVQGSELQVMDLMPVPLRALKLNEKQSQELGKLLDLQYLFMGDLRVKSGGESIELSLRLVSVEHGKTVAQGAARSSGKGNIEPSVRELSSQVSNDLASQIETQWGAGTAAGLPTVLVKVTQIRNFDDYMNVRNALQQLRESVQNVVEYEQSAGQATFLLELKMEPTQFFSVAKGLRSKGLAWSGQSVAATIHAPAMVELQWVR